MLGLDEVPDDAVVVPIDPNDWLAPELARRIEAARDTACIAWHWRREVLSVPHEDGRKGLSLWRRRRRRSEPDLCGGCNYAITNRTAFAAVIASPHSASDYFAANGNFVRELPQTLGIENRSLASRSSLAPASTPDLAGRTRPGSRKPSPAVREAPPVATDALGQALRRTHARADERDRTPLTDAISPLVSRTLRPPGPRPGTPGPSPSPTRCRPTTGCSGSWPHPPGRKCAERRSSPRSSGLPTRSAFR